MCACLCCSRTSSPLTTYTHTRTRTRARTHTHYLFFTDMFLLLDKQTNIFTVIVTLAAIWPSILIHAPYLSICLHIACIHLHLQCHLSTLAMPLADTPLIHSPSCHTAAATIAPSLHVAAPLRPLSPARCGRSKEWQGGGERALQPTVGRGPAVSHSPPCGPGSSSSSSSSSSFSSSQRSINNGWVEVA